MATTPSSQGTKPRSKRKKIDNPPKKRTEDEELAVDEAVERRVPARQLRLRITRLSRQIYEALGRHKELWLSLEAALNELKIQREAAYFELGFEQGFAAGRSSVEREDSSLRDLAAKLRDTAIRCCTREDGLVAMLDAARALAVGPGRRTTALTATRSYSAAYAAALARASRDADGPLH